MQKELIVQRSSRYKVFSTCSFTYIKEFFLTYIKDFLKGSFGFNM